MLARAMLTASAPEGPNVISSTNQAASPATSPRGAITLAQFVFGMATIHHGDPTSRAKMLHAAFDLDHDGLVGKDDLVAVLETLPPPPSAAASAFASADAVAEWVANKTVSRWFDTYDCAHPSLVPASTSVDAKWPLDHSGRGRGGAMASGGGRMGIMTGIDLPHFIDLLAAQAQGGGEGGGGSTPIQWLVGLFDWNSPLCLGISL